MTMMTMKRSIGTLKAKVNAVLFRAWDSQARPAILEELQAAEEESAFEAG